MGKECKNCVVGLFGVCNDYCRPEREGLIEEAQQLAEQHGHSLGEFIKVKDHPIWEARCVHCGQMAAINLDPPVSQPDVYGTALSADCTEIDVKRSAQEPREG
jgi:hypothetical protein